MNRKQFLSAGLAAGGALVSAPVSAYPKLIEPEFSGKVVIITGATSGIGRHTAKAFAARGASVFVCGRREHLGQSLVEEITERGGKAEFMKTDVREASQLKRFVDTCMERYGRIDVAFNNAGIAVNANEPLADQPETDWHDVMATNATGVFLSMRYQIPYMLKNSPDRLGVKGVIINNASVSGHRGFKNLVPYSASKHAILGITRCAAIEYGPLGLRINSISPGGVDTPMRNKVYTSRGLSSEQIPPVPNFQRRVNTVDEIADVVINLSGPASSSVWGTDLDLSGGMLTGPFFT